MKSLCRQWFSHGSVMTSFKLTVLEFKCFLVYITFVRNRAIVVYGTVQMGKDMEGKLIEYDHS